MEKTSIMNSLFLHLFFLASSYESLVGSVSVLIMLFVKTGVIS